MKFIKTVAAIVLVSSLSQVMVSRVLAMSPTKHPRRAELNVRLRNQQKRIAAGVKSGKMTTKQAAKIERKEASVKRQEHRDVKKNGGYLTKDQQRKLNETEDRLSRDIAAEKH